MRTLLAVLSLLWLSTGYTASITGVASVIDGDTLEIRGQRIRLHGIDAPESRQLCTRKSDGKSWRCGQAAALALSDFIGQKNVTCEQTAKDRYGRIVAVCSIRTTNLNRWLVGQGWALDWPRYSKGEYSQDQIEAEDRKRGIWSSNFTVPWKWRKQKR